MKIRTLLRGTVTPHQMQKEIGCGRYSSICITSSASIWFMINLLTLDLKPTNTDWDMMVAAKTRCITISSICFICGTAYAFVRNFLVLELLISIRQLQIEACNLHI
jgi:hypothetical protein